MVNNKYKSYKYRLYPNKEQEVLLSKHFGCARFVYNHFLNEKIQQYKETKKSDGYFKHCSSLVALKKSDDHLWLREVYSQTLNAALKNLDFAFDMFFKGKARLPKFKIKKSRSSFTVPQFSKLVGDKLILPKFKSGIKIVQHRKPEGKLCKVIITRTPSNKYFAVILYEQDNQSEKILLPKTGKQIGMDLGIKTYIKDSNNTSYQNIDTRKFYLKISKSNKHLSRKVKGSNSYEKQRRKVALMHEKLSLSREDFLHKMTKNLVRDNDLICVEDLDIMGLIKKSRNPTKILDSSWNTLVKYLEYKCDLYGKTLIKVSTFYPSSKLCNVCDFKNEKLKLKDRFWECPNGHVLDRDLNAAKNILKEGLRLKSLGDSDHKDGDEIRPLLEA